MEKIFIVLIHETFDYNRYTKSEVFSTREKAEEYVRHCIENYKAEMDCLNMTDEDFLKAVRDNGYDGEIDGNKSIDVYLDGYASQEEYNVWIVEKTIDEMAE